MLGIFALVVDDSARFLQAVTPERAASTIWMAGGVLFLVKLGAWLRGRRTSVSADHAPAERPTADRGKTAHRYGR
jgi:uncharacterized protein involved in response to NO